VVLPLLGPERCRRASRKGRKGREDMVHLPPTFCFVVLVVVLVLVLDSLGCLFTQKNRGRRRGRERARGVCGGGRPACRRAAASSPAEITSHAAEPVENLLRTGLAQRFFRVAGGTPSTAGRMPAATVQGFRARSFVRRILGVRLFCIVRAGGEGRGTRPPKRSDGG
jgi:hypothetical protein